MTNGPSIAELEAQAKAGVPRAKYALAAHLHQAGRRSEAESWLQAAAHDGEPDALYTLATRELQTIKGVAAATVLLERATKGRSAAAARLLAVLRAEGYGAEPDWNSACSAVLNLARAGDAPAMREIAGLLFLADPSDADGAWLIDAAAAAGDAIASAILVRRSASRRPLGSRKGADLALARLAAAKYPRLEALRAALSNAPPTEESAPEPDWDAVEGKLKSALGVAAPAPEIISSAPDARMIRAAFCDEALEYVVAHSALRLAPSMTTDSRDGSVRRDEYRTSLTATLGPVDQDLVIVAVNRRIASLAGLDRRQGEFLSVLRYAPGQQYRAHFDWLAPGPDFDRGGQRIMTALLYLNDDYGGGETYFYEPDLRVKGAPGDVLIFANVRRDGSIDRASRHAGLPVTAGAKWLASKWFRERAYEF